MATALGKADLQDLQALFEKNHSQELWAVLAEEPCRVGSGAELALATRLSGSQTDLNGNFLSQMVDVKRRIR
ncbi:MAG: hypothetical protein R3D55_24775 [Chloroflexota bacterium]